MNCPKCGAAVQPYDRFCIRCGHDMQPTGASAPERGQASQASQATPTYNGSPSAGAYPPPASPWQTPSAGTAPGQPYGGSAQQGPFGNWTPGQQRQQGQQGQAAPGAGGTNWASGSSTPGTNPYANTPSTVSSGTMLNGRPANAGGKGLFQGLGAAVVAFFVILGKFGGAIASIGFFKLYFFAWIFHGLFHTSFGTLFLILIVVAIIAGFARSRGMV